MRLRGRWGLCRAKSLLSLESTQEPLRHSHHRLALEPVEDALPTPLSVYQLGRPQDPEVARHRLVLKNEMGGYRPNALLAPVQNKQNLAPCRVAQGGEELVELSLFSAGAGVVVHRRSLRRSCKSAIQCIARRLEPRAGSSEG